MSSTAHPIHGLPETLSARCRTSQGTPAGGCLEKQVGGHAWLRRAPPLRQTPPGVGEAPGACSGGLV
eukprot:15431443-Alexandrium_andersonii.AAC.1